MTSDVLVKSPAAAATGLISVLGRMLGGGVKAAKSGAKGLVSAAKKDPLGSMAATQMVGSKISEPGLKTQQTLQSARDAHNQAGTTSGTQPGVSYGTNKAYPLDDAWFLLKQA
jgi:hypothetical protein